MMTIILMILAIMYLVGYNVGTGLAILTIVVCSFKMVYKLSKACMTIYGDDPKHTFWYSVKQSYNKHLIKEIGVDK